MEGGVTPFTSGMAPSGSYILIVVSQPLTEEHKKIILQRLDKGLLSWDVSSTGCDLSGLEYALSANIKDSVTESDVLIQHSTESLGVEVLLSPTVRTLKQCVKNLLSTPTSHKQLIHAGYAFAGSGSWIVENGTFSFEEFLEIFKQANEQNQKRCTINVHCAEEGNWSKHNFGKDVFTKCADVSLNPSEKVNHVPGSEHLIKCLDSALITQTLDEMMKPSPLVGNIRFNRPTIYMFPAGQGDCALFGINGFNMLIDGGFHRKPCSWDFVRHLDRLDAVLVTRIGESNVCGMSTLMKRNALNNANPQIGYVFCNIAENKTSPMKDGSVATKDDLIVSVVGEGHNFVQTLNDLKLKPHQCWRDSSIDPFVLYHKVGQGTLEMHVLSPPRDSKEMKQFLSEWNAYKETFTGVKSELKGVENMIPLSHATSICAILVWRPEDPKDTITRILFPGSAPQNKILEGLDKLKVLNILNHPVVTKASLNIPSSKVISNKVEKSVSRSALPNRNNTASPVLSVSSIASRNGDIGGHKKDVKELKKVTKEVKKESKEVKKEVKREIKNDSSRDIKKDVKLESTAKRELVKKDSVKETKKETRDVKKVIKKEIKEVKAVNDKKLEVKAAPKKESTTPNAKGIAEVKKTAAAKKSTTPVKKDVGKPPIAPKVAEAKKSLSKVSEPKAAKDVTNKKTIEAKTVAKSKPKSTTASPKSSTTPKTKPVAVPKPGSKMTKAVAASSIVASAVAVTAAAVELNEKKEVIEDAEPEISEKEVEVNGEIKEVAANEKSVEDVVSPLPPEALSPTPSESVSLTPSDTLSSAPLETVSPTPPLPNEPISTEEKDVNEIKELEQDMPYEQDKVVQNIEVQSIGNDELKSENEVNDIEAEIAKHQASSDVMSTSFIADKQLDDKQVEEHIEATEVKENESAPLKVNVEAETFSEKDALDEKEVVEEKGFDEEIHDMGEKDVVDEKEVIDEKEVEEKDVADEKDIADERSVTENEDIVEDKDVEEDKEIAGDIKSFDEKESAVDQESVEEKEDIENEESTDENDTTKEKDVVEEKHATQENTVEEKDAMEEQNNAEEEEVADEGIVEGKDDVLEKDVIEEKEIHQSNDLKSALESNDYEKSYTENKKEIDDQLAGLTMEGSYCAGMMPPTEKDILPDTETDFVQINENNDNVSIDDYLKDDKNQEGDIVEEKFEKTTISESESHFKSDTFESKTVESVAMDNYNQEANATSTTAVIHDEEPQHVEEYQSSECVSEDKNKYDKDHIEQIRYEMTETVGHSTEHFNEYEYKTNVNEHDEIRETNFDRFSQLHSMEESFHQDAYEHYGHPANIDDLDMQETSVDEPEEIVRKESVVSITLNDENPEDHYTDNWRRKSGTESEDDVDIGKYMCKEQAVDDEKLQVQRGSDSDEEDVVKSPTPHAVVDYEGQLDEVVSSEEQSKDSQDMGKESIETNKEAYRNEKEDFDEKDRDSAEDQDTDDGEMIRHPTPPEMRYSEEEMRDPIGQHYITNPSLKIQSSDITEQPLYEEAEDSESERSASPIIEQPVFGNAVQADFPELVTVSGGTTPSEPQSPKANFDNRKIPSETAVMEALSEHDVSESSTHSPSCQDGSTAFDLQASEKSVIEVQSLQDDEVSKLSENKSDLQPLDKSTPSELDNIAATEESSNIEKKTIDDKDDNQEDNKETPSDEEESSSEDENSESHSKDKSDAMGDKSDVERDDRSDIHNDDKSDHHYDGKSDIVNDDDDKSDIHEDEHLYTQQSKHIEHEMEELIQKEVKDFKEESEECYDNVEHVQYENQHPRDTELGNQSVITSDMLEQPASKVDEMIDMGYCEDFSKTQPENIQTVDPFENKDNSDNIHEAASVEPLNPSVSEKESTVPDYGVHDIHGAAGSRNILDYESSFRSENFGSEFQYEAPTDAYLGKKLSDYDSESTQSSHLNELEHSDKIDDGEGSGTFQENEANFENSESNTDVHGINTSNREIEKEAAPMKPESEFLVESISEFSQEIPSGFGNSDPIELEHHEDESYKVPVDLHEDVSSQNNENFSAVESKILPETTEAHRYDNLSQYEDNMHTTNEVYSESTLIKNVISADDQSEMHMVIEKAGMQDTDFEVLTSHEMKSFTSTNTYEHSPVTVDNIVAEMSGYENASSYNKTDIMSESYSKNCYDEYGIEKTMDNISSVVDDYKQENYSHPDEHKQYFQSETKFTESHSTYELPADITSSHFEVECTEMASKNGFSSDRTDINFNGEERSKPSADAQEFSLVNGKDQASFSLPSSELTTEFYKAEISHNESISTVTQPIEQESTYLINSRFHSESPEDNTMRSDSSPDVPYPVQIQDKFSEIKNSMSIETCSESYIRSTEDYTNNMNFSSTDGIPHSPQNHALNANQNNAYAESSEDEGNSLVRGNVSPYAYTNKAYTREEEDIDGNHIYKEETTEVIKQVEFDGNNLQTLGTNQVGSVMNYSQEFQDVQYTAGANYDFRLEEWGKPMGLPTPPDSSQKTLKKSEKTTVKAKTAVDANGKIHSPSVSSKMSSPLKKPKPKVAKESSSSPVYVDLAYVPQHADPQYCDVEFFKKIRARYYVISSVNPSKEVLNALLEAKKTWNEDLSVTIIPTYETDTLGYWMAQNQNDLAEYSIDVSPSASRCTVNLQDHQTSCSAYRLEF